jgi:GTP cyclohydrolase I
MPEFDTFLTDSFRMAEQLEKYAGLDTNDEHGEDTPARFLKFLDEITGCKEREDETDQEQHLKDCIKWKMFQSSGDEMIVVEKIPFTSVCNHHVVPFIGHANIAYVPEKWNAGLSKFARVVKHFARQLQIQERLTEEVAEYLNFQLSPKGVAVVIRAEHMCMTIRGVQAPGTMTTTSAMKGVFADHSRTAKAEFLNLIR